MNMLHNTIIGTIALTIIACLMFAPLKALSPEDVQARYTSYEQAEQALAEWPIHHYPYSYLPDELEESGIDSLPLFAYGSLVSYDSARRTLSEETLATREPVVAFAIKRIFDADVTVRPDSVWGQPVDPEARGMLNIHTTEDASDRVNGVVFQMPAAEICPVFHRETGYDLVPVIISHWDDVKDGVASYSIAYGFQRPSPGPFTSDSILPRPGYYEASRDAAAEYGYDFLQLWLDGTFFADAKTPISIWEQMIEDQDPRTQIQD